MIGSASQIIQFNDIDHDGDDEDDDNNIDFNNNQCWCLFIVSYFLEVSPQIA